MSNLIIILVLAIILGGAAAYVIKAKKNGHKCIGCPDGCCPSAMHCNGDSPCSGCCGCPGGSSKQ